MGKVMNSIGPARPKALQCRLGPKAETAWPARNTDMTCVRAGPVTMPGAAVVTLLPAVNRQPRCRSIDAVSTPRVRRTRQATQLGRKLIEASHRWWGGLDDGDKRRFEATSVLRWSPAALVSRGREGSEARSRIRRRGVGAGSHRGMVAQQLYFVIPAWRKTSGGQRR
jgi:hypothetical protein